MPEPMLDRNDPAYLDFVGCCSHLPRSDGIIANTFEELEPPAAIKAISEGLCAPDSPTPPIYYIGPLIDEEKASGSAHSEEECLTGFHISVKVGSNIDCRVVDLINEEGDWDVASVERIGTVQEAEAILNIPIVRSAARDKLIWSFNRNGKFSVKSGYWLAMKDGRAGFGVGNGAPVVTEYWKHLWKLQVPPKILHFLWRCSNGYIPCMESLLKRRITQDAICIRCQQFDETPLHATWQCKDCVAVLEGASFYSSLTTLQVTSFSSLIEFAMKVLTVDEMKLLVIMLWSNWKERNSFVHGIPTKPPLVVLWELCFNLEEPPGSSRFSFI
ncbi:hypothetical protein M0R45_026841 [Rubus argutus]|uniref:Reverse transcriptase zinc-binding domain-containing protein n=1 Tax=Rubus argutus TaxID=59490 RepID=A0AAW1X178_RUBAR